MRRISGLSASNSTQQAHTSWRHIALRLTLIAIVLTGLWVAAPSTTKQAAAITGWTAVSSGNVSTCALDSGGYAYCWGKNLNGEIGDGTNTERMSATPVLGGLTFASISVMRDAACGIATSGPTYCWGLNDQGQLGDGTTTDRNVPTLVAGGHTFSAIDGSFGTMCAVEASTNSAYCWGDNFHGEVGDGTTTDRNVPTAVTGGLSFNSVKSGLHSCGLTTTNTAYCWGANTYGEIGDNTTTDRPSPTAVNGGTAYSSITIGMYHTCALRSSDGASYCWGTNSVDALGDGTTTDRHIPTPTSGGLVFSSITAGAYSTCAIQQSTNALFCWGYNSITGTGVGQLGDGTTTNRSAPTAVLGGYSWTFVDGGEYYNCGRISTGELKCWGANWDGQGGYGDKNRQLSPVTVQGGHSFSAIATGGSFNCGLSSGAAYCWGDNTNGELGDGTNTYRPVPTLVSGGHTFTSISAGDRHVCAVTAGGNAYCWGYNGFGNLGDGTTTDRTVPTAVTGGLRFSNISAGTWGTCAITSATSTAYCWGHNTWGDLGDGTNTERDAPTAVTGGQNWSSIVMAYGHTCAIESSTNDLYCWGLNNTGQNGDGTTTDSNSPTQVSGSDTYSQVSTYQYETCAVNTGGSAFCWGNNTDAQIGDGTTTLRYTPTAVIGGHTFSYVSVGLASVCGSTPGNSIYCWGRNWHGEFGDGTAEIRTPTPELVLGGSTAYTVVSLGQYVACGLASGAAACWGTDDYAEMGDGSTQHFTPTTVDWPPNAPSSLAQYHSDGVTPISAGGASSESSVVIKASGGDTDGSQTIKICVEIEPAGTPFTGVANYCGPLGSQGTVSVTVPVSSGTTYHWQAQIVDSDGGASPWIQYNSGAAAFSDDSVAPSTPTSLVQQKSNGTGLGVGAWSSDANVVIKATVSDDSGQAVLCYEIKPLGTGFGNTNTACGSAVSSGSTASVTSTLTDATQFHWQVRAKDASGNYSGWTSFGSNGEGVRDVGVDTTAPTAGIVNDGSSVGIDSGYNSGALDTLSANWSFNSNVSGIASYNYAIGTTPGGYDIVGWTNGTATASATVTGLTLHTGQAYYFSVQAVDNAGNVSSVFTSNGQAVAPILTFVTSSQNISFGHVTPANGYAPAVQTETITASTNAYAGYTVRQVASGPLTSGSNTLPFYGSAYSAPSVWAGTGFGYTSSDTSIQGSGNIFGSGTKYAAFTTSGPGDIVADHQSPVTGTAVTNESFDLTYKLAGLATWKPGAYSTTIALEATAGY